MEVLNNFPDESVNCCVTSPPYYRLRDYGVDGQIGLEETPEQYVQKLVKVFSEVKRILRPDGTCWINLGDTYCGSGQGYGDTKTTNKSHNGSRQRRKPEWNSPDLKPKDLIGIPWMVAFALRQPYEKHLIDNIADRAYIAGLIDGEGCITILRTKSSHSESYSYPPIVQVRMCDTESIDFFAQLMDVNRSEAELYNSHKNANQRESYNVKVVSKKAMNLIADVYPFLKVKRKQAIVAYNHQLFRNKTNYQERTDEQIKREIFCKELINKINQRQDTEIPSWMVEPKIVSEQGWFLRQDLIWHKPNPMPESVTDRCTKSHEYIFLLSKSAQYYYDADAIKERSITIPHARGNIGKKPEGKIRQSSQNVSDVNRIFGADGYSNKRSVWSVNVNPFSEAHFATFPEDLIVPCIKAGCPEGGIVLDPFMGAGTTGLVARKLNRNYVGIELNPEYIKIAEKRIFNEIGLFQ
jgi:DNA modification methylase